MRYCKTLISIFVLFFLTQAIVTAGAKITQNKKFNTIQGSDEDIELIKNATFILSGGEYKFSNGKWEDIDLMASMGMGVTPTSYTGYPSEYCVSISGNPGGGNSFWGYLIVVHSTASRTSGPRMPWASHARTRRASALSAG